MNKYSQAVADFYEGRTKLPDNFKIIYMRHIRKLRTRIDYPTTTAQIIYRHNWHYASQYGYICPGFYGYSA